jgi:hypothetical protein
MVAHGITPASPPANRVPADQPTRVIWKSVVTQVPIEAEVVPADRVREAGGRRHADPEHPAAAGATTVALHDPDQRRRW